MDPELQAHWARYMCVLVSGFLETSVRSIYSEYAKEKASPNVVNFVQNQLKQFQNPNMEKLLQLAGQFNPQWREWLEAATLDEPKAAVDSIVSNRHAIAHGIQVGITLSQVKRYYDGVVYVLNTIEKHCHKDSS